MVDSDVYSMSLPLCIRRVSLAICLLTSYAVGFGQDFVEQGQEYAIAGSPVGDQVNVSAAVSASGGLVVWEDNFTDGDGSGISARRLDSSLSGMFGKFVVNDIGVGNQRKPAASVLSDGGAVVVWQNEQDADSDIRLRCFSSGSYTNFGSDVLVNTHTLDQQVDPAVAALDGGEFVVVWASYNQVSATSMKDIYFRRFDNTGNPLGDPVLANQKFTLNQRTPDVCRLSDGSFLVVWISETQQIIGAGNEVYDVDVVARRFSSTGAPMDNEFKVNTTQNPCANPTVAVAAGGGFAAAWSQKDLSNSSNSWEVVARSYVAPGGAGSTPVTLNAHSYGDQFGPQLAAVGGDYFAIWTSMGQDGSHEGVFGRFLLGAGAISGDEVPVNSTVVGKQILPTLASDGGTRFLAVWSGFTGIAAGFDAYAQRFASVTEPLAAPDAPYAWPLNFSDISVAWAELAGFEVGSYQVYVDGAATPTASITNNQWLLTNVAPYSTHTFRLAYVLEDGRTSPLSAETTATTYGQYGTLTYGAIVPFDWMAANWGLDLSVWPNAGDDSDGDGASNENEFLAGTDPNDPNSVLRTALVPTVQGFFLDWNTEPGRIYQVQKSGDFLSWSDFGGARFAHGATDSINVGGGGSGLFRVVLLRN